MKINKKRLNFSHAVYTPGITNSGIILLCDPMNTELMGSRLMMQQFQEAGHHVIKPNLFQVHSLFRKNDEFFIFLVARFAYRFHERDRFVFWQKRRNQEYSKAGGFESKIFTESRLRDDFFNRNGLELVLAKGAIDDR